MDMIWQVYLLEPGQAYPQVDFGSRIYSNPTEEKTLGPKSQVQILNTFKTVTFHLLERKTNNLPSI